MSEVFVSKAALTEAVYLSLHDNPHKDGKIRHNHNMEHHHFIHMIYHAPAADVVPVVHGRWVFDFSLGDYSFYKCSVCGRQEDLLDKENPDEYFPYCHCGAKMDLERKGKDR